MRASLLRSAIRFVPVRRQRLIKPIVRRLRPRLSYPDRPTVVSARLGNGSFEIRHYRDFIQRHIYFFGYWERKVSALITRLLRPGDVFIDIGANVGWFTILGARRVGPHGKVVAFEPGRETFDNLQANIRLNRLANVTAENLAIADIDGVALLSGIDDRCTALGSIARDDIASGETVTSVRFDNYWQSTCNKPIRLIKMDIEGAEMKALSGMDDLLRRQLCDYLIVEVNNETLAWAGSTPQHVLSLLGKYRYRLYRITSKGASPLESVPDTGHINVLAVSLHQECGWLDGDARPAGPHFPASRRG
jgi:FkbM family methyltransferase